MPEKGTPDDSPFSAPPAAEQAELGRRGFLTLLGVGAAGVACNQNPTRDFLPFARDVPQEVPGRALHYATAMVVDGYASGLLVRTREGRPIKVDGNPAHPASLGAANSWAQASVFQLYDPHRATSLRQGHEPASRAAFLQWMNPERSGRLRLLMEPTTSALVQSLLSQMQARYPGMRTHFHGSTHHRTRRRGIEAGIGAGLEPVYDLSRATTIVCLDADPLAPPEPLSQRYSRQYASRRRGVGRTGEMNRMYVVEPTWTVTGSIADHRLARRAGEVPAIALELLAEVLALGRTGDMPAALRQSVLEHRAPGELRPKLAALARDLVQHAGESVVIAGDGQPPAVHAAAFALNTLLGNVGRTLRLVPTPLVDGPDLAALAADVRSGAVDTLLVLEGNPAYASPVDIGFGELLGKVPRTAYLGLYENETAARCQWMLPGQHFLESWGDARAVDGTATILQPLIAPLYDGLSAAELLALLVTEPASGPPPLSLRDRLKETWNGQLADDAAFDRAVQRGVIDGTAFSDAPFSWSWNQLGALLPQLVRRPAKIELALRPDYRVLDGRFSNVPWLQELPDPATRLTWDNAALMHPTTAAGLGVKDAQMAELRLGERSVNAAVLIEQGQAEGSVTLTFGYGRTARKEAYAVHRGANAYLVQTDANPTGGEGLQVTGTALRTRLAVTHPFEDLHGREEKIARLLTAEEAEASAPFAPPGTFPALYGHDYKGVQWGMVIDQSICHGCSACVTACDVENNIVFVGKDDVLRGRQMHWIRIDRYRVGTESEPRAFTQPMLCQHCEKAPCEYVCPVNATTHSPDGLNEMTYNRCVGTRFCSNNCPYKVRRFNWHAYYKERAPAQKLATNPEVTMRQRGVIEKCSYCVQRIRGGEIRAQVEGRTLGGNEISTACQDACPTRAIVFGQVSEPDSEVSRWGRSPLLYRALDELGTLPRTRYLARVFNPNPEWS